MKRLAVLTETERSADTGSWEFVEPAMARSDEERAADCCYKLFVPLPGIQSFRVVVRLQGCAGGGLTRAGSYTFQIGTENMPVTRIGHGERIVSVTGRFRISPTGERELLYERAQGMIRMEMDGEVLLEAQDPQPSERIFDWAFALPAGVRMIEISVEGDEAEKRCSGIIHPVTAYNLHVCIDFYDDLIENAWSERTFREAMAFYAVNRIRRVYFMDMYGYRSGMWDIRGRSPNCFPLQQRNIDKTYAAVGEFLPACVRTAHAAGLEAFALLKLNEFGFQYTSPHGSEGATRFGKVPRLDGMMWWCSRFVAEHPHLRLERHMRDMPGDLERLVIRSIVLSAEEGCESDTFIPRLWVSRDNAIYEPYCGPMVVHRNGDKLLALDELRITEPFLAVDPEGRTAHRFGNTLRRLVEVRDEAGNMLPISYGLRYQPGAAPWTGAGFVYDHSGDFCNSLDDYAWLDGGRPIGVARGHERYLSGVLCEAYPEVQDRWMREIERCIEAGVDGIDFRFNTHTRTLDWDVFGYNPPLVEAYAKRYGADIMREPFDPEKMQMLRGDIYTRFLRRAKARLNKAGKRMILHVEGDDFAPGAKAHMNVHFDWPTWLAEGLVDEITLNSSSAHGMSSPPVVSAAHECGIPVNFRPHFSSIRSSPNGALAIAAARQDALAGGVDGFIIYENNSFMAAQADGGIALTAPWLVEELKTNAR